MTTKYSADNEIGNVFFHFTQVGIIGAPPLEHEAVREISTLAPSAIAHFTAAISS